MQRVPVARRPWIAYAGPFDFPDGGAAARRVLGNAQSFVALGYEVVILSGQSDQYGTDLREFMPGIFLASMQERSASELPRAVQLLRYTNMGRKTRLWLDAQDIPPDRVMLYSGYTPYLLQLTGWSRRRGIPVFFDAVEWYTATSALQFATSPYLWNIELSMRVLLKRLDGVIAISSYLARYYAQSGMPVALVPPTLDTGAIVPRLKSEDGSRLVLAYCGSPGTKDLLSEIIEAVIGLDESGTRLELHIVGPDMAEVMALPALVGRCVGGLPGAVKVHGRVSHQRSLDVMRAADCSIFLRRDNRVSRAGFPTKFVESVALGTPVITNISSDLADYLVHGETGFIAPGPAANELAPILLEALETGAAARSAMRWASRQLAETRFDYRRFLQPLAKLLGTAARPMAYLSAQKP